MLSDLTAYLISKESNGLSLKVNINRVSYSQHGNVAAFMTEIGPSETFDALRSFDHIRSVDSSLLSEEKENGRAKSSSRRHVVTMISSTGISIGQLFHTIAALLDRSCSILAIKSLSRPDVCVTALDVVFVSAYKTVEGMSGTVSIDLSAVRRDFYDLGSVLGIDIAVQPMNAFRRGKRLFVFDMDSTLIQQEVIDEIAKHAGVVEEVSKITESAMRGEIDFVESLRRRVAMLRGTPSSVIDTVRSNITFNPGVKELCTALKRSGCKMAVISGNTIVRIILV